MRRLELGCDVLGLSSGSYLQSWQLGVHHTAWRGRYTRLVSRVYWSMWMRPGQWRKQICKVWWGRNGWWWDGCAGCRWEIGIAVWIFLFYSLLGVQCVAEVVRHSRLRWFGHVERKSGDDWVSACRNVVVAGVKRAGKGRKTWYECVEDYMDKLDLHSELMVFRDIWRDLISGKTSSDPSWAWKK